MVRVPVDEELTVALRGPVLVAADRRVLEAFAAEAAVALRQQRLAEKAATVGRLTEVDRLRTALLTAVGHDFRTPLAAAKAAVTSLRSPDVIFSAADQAELLATAEESLDRLSRLVENLLDMSRLQAGGLALHRQPISVLELIPRAIDDLGDLGRDVLVPDTDDVPDVSADAALLERVLANLVANAVHYSPPGRPPMVTVSAHESRVEVRVVDHGPGIPVGDYDRVFQTFQRLGDRDNTTGLGLGLALSRGLTEAMGGTLSPDTTPGGGLTLTVALPVADTIDTPAMGPGRPGPRRTGAGIVPTAPGGPDVSATDQQVDPSVGGSPRPTRVLVVDDEPQLLRALRINLTARRYDVTTAPDGASALQAASTRPPDLVVLDLGLPDMDGVDVIRHLRGWTLVPIIVLSGHAGSSDKVHALDAGADDYVTKPFSLDELLARIHAVTRRTGAAEGAPAVTIGRYRVNLGERTVHPLRPRGPGAAADPHRMGTAGGAGQQPGQTDHPTQPAATGLGTRLPGPDPLPAPVHGPPAPQTRGQPGPPPAPAHRTRHGLPVHTMNHQLPAQQRYRR